MTDSSEVLTVGALFSEKRAVILTRGIAAIHNAAAFFFVALFSHQGGFLIIFLPSLWCQSSPERCEKPHSGSGFLYDVHTDIKDLAWFF